MVGLIIIGVGGCSEQVKNSNDVVLHPVKVAFIIEQRNHDGNYEVCHW